MSRIGADERVHLRAIEIQAIDHHGPAYMLHDPLRLADGYVLVPQALGPLLALLDGSHTYAELYTLVSKQLGAVSGPALLQQILDTLDQAFLLDNDTFRVALDQARATYRAAPYRPPMMAGEAYPEHPSELRQFFDHLLEQAGDVERSSPNSRALLSPHIDYPRGGHVYAQVWKSAADAVRAADLVFLLATDHYSPEPITLTHQSYATPYGVLPTDPAIVDLLAKPLGDAAFAAELYHRREHSVELVATWLHHMRDGLPCTLVPILCGSFQQYTHNKAQPTNNPAIAALVAGIQHVAAQRNVLFVISGDLAHVGPAFGDAALNPATERRVQAQDQRVIEQLCAGNADGLLQTIRTIRDRNNICGLPPAYLVLSALGSTHGELLEYARCPADETNTSAVTIAGIVFS
ncbi:MAG: AmmeMemoRadiSam system protein B [Roseiflexaceae bacterium]|nr:AmmeMemoRadiSam system protein B [Roseiflexaceae bacterium]